MTKIVSQICCIALVSCSLSLTGCGDADAPTVIGGPTPEILEWQAKNAAEFENTMEKSYSGG